MKSTLWQTKYTGKLMAENAATLSISLLLRRLTALSP